MPLRLRPAATESLPIPQQDCQKLCQGQPFMGLGTWTMLNFNGLDLLRTSTGIMWDSCLCSHQKLRFYYKLWTNKMGHAFIIHGCNMVWHGITMYKPTTSNNQHDTLANTMENKIYILQEKTYSTGMSCQTCLCQKFKTLKSTDGSVIVLCSFFAFFPHQNASVGRRFLVECM